MMTNSFSYNGPKLGYDGTFKLNEFSQPKVISEIELVKNVLLYVLFTKPGQYPSLPNIGMDIETLLYSFYDELDTNDLTKDICAQCNALGFYFNNGTIQIKKIKYQNIPSLIIYVEGTEIFPDSAIYLSDVNNQLNSNKYMIGITFDELNKMVYNVSNGMEV